MSVTPVEATTVAPWAASVEGVQALLPEAKIVETVTPGVRAITRAQVTAWLADFSRSVALRLDGWERLRATPTLAETEALAEPPREQLIAFARLVVETGVASIAEAARYPERAEGGYAAVLWERYQTALTELSEWVARQLAGGGDDDALIGPTSGIAASFPAPSFTPETLRF